jgi:NTP pyrophosphatase (non-canonical NTP hydrolase)
MTFEEYSELNRRLTEAPDGFATPVSSLSPAEWCTALVGEVGEVANLLKKLSRLRDGRPGNKPDETAEALTAELPGELADAYNYLDLLAMRCGVVLGKAVRDKFDETALKRGSTLRCPPEE